MVIAFAYSKYYTHLEVRIVRPLRRYRTRTLMPVSALCNQSSAAPLIRRACRSLSETVGQPMTLIRVLVPASPAHPAVAGALSEGRNLS